MKNHFIQLCRSVLCLLFYAAVATGSSGQTAGKLVVNEIDYDQPSHDTAEFIEILNRSAASVDLSFYSVELINGTGGGAKTYGRFQLPQVVLPPGGYFVLCTDKTTVPNCDTALLKSIQNGAPDAVLLKLNNTLVDVVSYEGNSGPYFEGSGSGLLDPGTGGQGGPNEHKSISRFPDGADTNSNSEDFSLRCATPGAPNMERSEECSLAEI